jgi:hemolysin activation/secretion protein
VRADGQWASEPLISNEQFTAGGVNSVRGYDEGQVSGDTGWHASLELKTPPHIAGTVSGNTQLVLRGVLYTDYAEVYLIDPLGRPGRTQIWSAGFGGAASVGSHWDTRLLISFPLRENGNIEQYTPRFTFSITGQF